MKTIHFTDQGALLHAYPAAIPMKQWLQEEAAPSGKCLYTIFRKLQKKTNWPEHLRLKVNPRVIWIQEPAK